MEESKIYFVGEIGCNHCGSLDVAKMMIYLAKKVCKIDGVKFQKRTVRKCLTEREYDMPHPIPSNSYGYTYGEHREYLEFTTEQHKILKEYCEEIGIDYGVSVWDENAAEEMISINPDFIKIPSACNSNINLIEYVAINYKGPIHVSLGMLAKQEKEELLGYFLHSQYAERLVVYHCTSGYPVPVSQMCLLEISDLCKYSRNKFLGIGFSGHHKGIDIDCMAISLGARYVERHYTLNHFLKGTDHCASLEPGEFRKLVRNCEDLTKALQRKPDKLMNIEEEQRRKLKWNRKK